MQHLQYAVVPRKMVTFTRNTAVLPSPPLKRHFQIFDTFRFLAFFKVFLQHLPITSWWWFNFLKGGGIIGVQFFFVLSGFLITYIVLQEKEAGTFQLKHFFMRRVLRIWPLYYLIISFCYVMPLLLSYAHIPQHDTGYTPQLLTSLFFVENYRMIATHNLPNVPELAVTWSLCVEEHFYIIWGIAFSLLPRKHYLTFLLVCIATGFAGRLVFLHYHLDPTDISTCIDLFAFGGLPAYLLMYAPHLGERIAARWRNIAVNGWYAIVLALVLIAAQIKDVTANFLWFPTLFGILFSTVLLLSVNRNQGKGGLPILNTAGIYTYGLYLYHLIFIGLLAKVFQLAHLSLDCWVNAALFALVALVCTLGWSILSYRFFEQPFLRLKQRYR